MGNPNLLELHSFEDTIKTTSHGQVPPQMMEFQVNPELEPFLVSSTRSVVWVEHAGSRGQIRAAVRSRATLEAEIVVAIAERGTRAQWGNVQSLTTAGIQQCREHLSSYGVGPVECLAAPDTDITGVDFKELPVIEAPWVPKGAVVVLPVDRGFVGTLGLVGPSLALAWVHNASRGVGIAHQ